jgi:hypothetical protein
MFETEFLNIGIHVAVALAAIEAGKHVYWDSSYPEPLPSLRFSDQILLRAILGVLLISLRQ